MKKAACIFILAVLASAVLSSWTAASAAEAAPYRVAVISAPAGSYTSFEEVPVDVGENELFCGWYTSAAAARTLNPHETAKQPAETMYGALLALPEDGGLRTVGARLYAKSPYGIRFVARMDKRLRTIVEALNVKNRAGKNGLLTPKTEHAAGIGYGMALAVETDLAAPLIKAAGSTVQSGVCVPGVYTFSESDTTFDYTATVLGIKTASYADDIAARPYLTYADANGVERTYLPAESGTRTGSYSVSLYTLAQDAWSDENASDAEKAAASALLADYAADEAISVTPITALNTDSRANSADGDNAYIETDHTTLRYLTKQNGDHFRYSKQAHYSRVIRVRDDFYLMFFQYSGSGQHIYYATSTDGIDWGTPAVLYDARKSSLTYESGSLEGTTDKYYAATADAVLLQNGEILVVYSRRPCKGYATNEYTALNTIELVRMQVSASNYVTVSSPVSIYHGHNWEPEIIQRANGRIEVYFTHTAPMIDIYGYLTQKRSSGVGMIVSDDNGYTWTPNVTANDTNHFAAKRVFQQFSCAKTVDGENVNFYSGQMPAVAEMSDGRLFLACEFEPEAQDGMLISAAVSDENGEWRELGIDEKGPENRYESLFRGAGPSVCRFDSGELLLSYNVNEKMYTRLLKKDASDLAGAYALDIFENTTSGTEKTSGFWSTVAVKDSHTALLSMAFPTYLGGGDSSTAEDDGAIGIVQGRLNHTVNASRKNVVADGNPREWAKVSEALFVGSESDAQASYRFAYDEKNVYICIDYINESRADGDSLFVLLETSNGTVTAQISAAGAVTAPNGVTGGGKRTANGGVYEFCLNRAVLGLTGGTLRVCPGFTKADGTTDKIDGMTNDPASWLKVNLETEAMAYSVNCESRLTPIAKLNTKGENGDHAGDDYETASIENDFRTRADLTYSAATAQNRSFRYQNAWYPRVKKVRDDLYLLLYHYGQLGLHMYYATSRDGVSWNPPEVLWNAKNHMFTYEGGELDGVTENYAAVNPDAVVLDNGDILCVYAVRAPKGYQTYADLCGLWMMRGKADDDGKISWSAETKIYTGQVWEPGIHQRSDGTVEVYFTQIAPYINLYGFDTEKRSAGVGMIVSKDGGYSWTPDIQPGNRNAYRATTVIQTELGSKIGPDGVSRPYFGGQMPVPVELYNGKTLVAYEIQYLDKTFWTSYATSGESGAWKRLALEEVGPDTLCPTPYKAASPYAARFLSGEVSLVYNKSSKLCGRIGSPEGTAFSETEFSALPDVTGIWGSEEIVGSHSVIFVNQSKRENPTPDNPKLDYLYGLSMIRAYLNHRINAPKLTVTVDGYTNDWDEPENTDALFVGSVSQAQMTLRCAHDDKYVYFLASVLDYDLEVGDSATVCIAAGDANWYRLTVGVNGACTLKSYENGSYKNMVSGAFSVVKVFGTVGDGSDTDEGYLAEIAVPKSAMGLSDAHSFKVRPAFTNVDGTTTVTDTLTGVSTAETSRWPAVALDS